MNVSEVTKKTYMVEHLDPELGSWSALEYRSIALESKLAGAAFCLTSVPKDMVVPKFLRETDGFTLDHRGIEEICRDSKERVCLLDPAAIEELSPEDGSRFDVFLFGGILGKAVQSFEGHYD